MDDLISRQAAIDTAVQSIRDWDRIFIHEANCRIRDAINELPSAQDPEIIRCKDCRYYQDNNNGYPHMDCKWNADETPDGDDFCSGAERRTDE